MEKILSKSFKFEGLAMTNTEAMRLIRIDRYITPTAIQIDFVQPLVVRPLRPHTLYRIEVVESDREIWFRTDDARAIAIRTPREFLQARVALPTEIPADEKEHFRVHLRLAA